MAAHVRKEIRDEILTAIKNGQKASDVADRYGVNRKTVYGWLGWQAKNAVSINDYHMLRRERDALLSIVGELLLRLRSKREKNLGSL